MRIQHNIMAMNAYRNYNTNTSALSKNLEKLSSGYKINRAGDDAAGLAISEKMRAQITGLDVAQKNAKDGISLVQTAEGALTEVHDMLNRMYELAEQSANGTYEDETDRAQLQKEVVQLRSEIDRIADATNFNGIKLLDGSLTGTTSTTSLSDVTVTSTVTAVEGTKGQAGSFEIDFSQLTVTNNSSGVQTVMINIGTFNFSVKVSANTTMSGTDILKGLTKTTGTFVANGATFTLSTDGGKLTATMEKDPTSSATAAQLQTQFSVTVATAANMTHNNGLNANSQTITSAIKAEDSKLASGTFTLQGVKDGYTIKIGNESYTFAVGKDSEFKNVANVIDLTKYDGTETDFSKIAADALTKAASNNSMVTVGHNGTGLISLTEKEKKIDHDVYDLTKTDGWKGLVQDGTASASDTTSGGLVLQIGDTSDPYNQLNVSINKCDTISLGISTLDIGDQTGAKDALNTIKKAINYVSDVRGTLGATQNRLEHTINNLGVMEENIQNAESTIRDTDVADEMMAYTKNNILIQSAQAMLAQANQVPQGVLQLLQ